MNSGHPSVSDEIGLDIENINLGGVSLELVVKNNTKERESSDYISEYCLYLYFTCLKLNLIINYCPNVLLESWANVSRGGAAGQMKGCSDDMTSLKNLKFEIVSARTVESRKHKKYVVCKVNGLYLPI